MRKNPTRHPLAVSLLAVLAMSAATSAYAQQATPANAQNQKTTEEPAKKSDTELGRVVITGSLIPQTEKETAKPVTVITADNIRQRGFNTVAEVLQQSSVSTGGVSNNQSSASFTQGAETMSMFGLPPGYVKYLIDGHPMANYPALYNGSDVFNNISNIPTDFIDRIEILPGGQSSLYGSDAIAGVVNIILKKRVDGLTIRARTGRYQEGGGRMARVSVTDGFSSKDERWNTLVSVQAEKTDPVWAYQRDLTKQFNPDGHTWNAAGQRIASPQLASRDWLVYSPITSYKFMDPANCANVTSAFGGTEGLQTRPGFGDAKYCGSMFSPGYRTLKNSKQGVQLSLRTTFKVNDLAEAYGDLLMSEEKVKYHVGANYTWWGTGLKWGYYYDPNLDDLVNLQRAFTPEDMGGNWEATMNTNKSRAYHLNLGVRGTMAEGSNWDYDIGITRTNYKLDQTGLQRMNDPINNYFLKNVLGPQQGLDPYYGAYPVFTPNYAAFYKTMPASDFFGFMKSLTSKAQTSDNLFRASFTNSVLFKLPGGDAGLAISGEWGTQNWTYTPAPELMNGAVWGTTDVSGNGKRSRYALVSELRLPIFNMLTASLSGRYDAYRAGDSSISKPTYSVGLEFRPFRSLLLRGQYGTAFRAPTLSDQFQGLSGFYSSTTDYWNCHLLGFEPGNTDNCPARFTNMQYFGQQSGNTDLRPINAKVWSYGIVWAPTARFSIGADYHHWNIRDEVSTQDVGQLMRDELDCRTGKLPASSGLCVAALGQIKRGAAGNVQSIYVRKVNIAQQKLAAITSNLQYRQPLGSLGDLSLSAQWTRKLNHQYKQYPTDPVIDLLNDPYNSYDPAYRADGSISWHKGPVTTTLYANYMGPTPNYRATIARGGYATPGAAKLSSYTLFNGSVGVEFSKAFGMSLMVTNLTNKMPTMDASNYPGSSGAPYNSYNFNVLGRGMYLEGRYTFGGKGN